MENKEPKHTIDELFHSSFQTDDKIVQKDWNTPSDEVWTNISAQLDDKSDRPTLWFILLPLLLLLSVGGYFVVEQLNLSTTLFTNSTQQTGASKSETAVVNQPNISTIENDDATTTIFDNTNQQSANSISSNSTSTSNSNQLSSSSLTSEISAGQEQMLFSTTNFQQEPEPLNQNSLSEPGRFNFTTTTNQLIAENQGQGNSLQSVSLLQTETNFRLANQLTKSEFEIPKQTNSLSQVPEVPEIKNDEKNLLFGLTAGLFSPNLDVESSYADALQPFNFSYQSQLSPEFGASVEIPITKTISISSGIRYTQLRFTASHNSPFTYALSDEVVVNESLRLENQTTFATALGTVEADVQLERISDELVNQTNTLAMDVDMNQQLHYLSLPVEPTIELSSTPKFSISLQPSVQFNVLVNQNTTLKNLDTNHSSIIDSNSSIQGKLQHLNNSYLSSGIGVQFSSSQLIPSTKIGIEPFYQFQNGNLFSTEQTAEQAGHVGVRIRFSK